MEAEPATSWTIRPATPEDLSELVRLNAFVQEQHVAAHPEVFRAPGEEERVRLFHDLVREPANRFWLAYGHAEQQDTYGHAWNSVPRRR